MIALVLLLLLSGCTVERVVLLEARPEDPAVIEWRQKVSAAVNEHEQRIDKLEGGDDGRPDPSTEQ